jgi:deazaflavin-dependent oxidoreductase (nitroreductase family)
LGPLLASPLTGSMVLLRTIGNKTGKVREAPLGYALVDGRVVVVAGYGRGTHWFRNALANPEVQVVVAGAVLAGQAAEIVEPDQRREAFRAVIAAEGLVGRMTLGDIDAASDERVDEFAAAFPVLAITPTAVRPGPHDPGGSFWLYPMAAGVIAVLVLIFAGKGRKSR